MPFSKLKSHIAEILRRRATSPPGPSPTPRGRQDADDHLKYGPNRGAPSPACADQQAGPAGLRQVHQPAQGARWPGHRDHLDVVRPAHRPQAARRAWAGKSYAGDIWRKEAAAMSRIGRQPVAIPSGCDRERRRPDRHRQGPEGHPGPTPWSPRSRWSRDESGLEVKRPDDERDQRSLHGLTRTLINNMVTGVTEGYEKKPRSSASGYRVLAKGSNLEFRSAPSPDHRRRPLGHHLRGREHRPASRSRASTSSSSARSPPTSASSASPTRTRQGVRYAGEHIRRKVGRLGK